MSVEIATGTLIWISLRPILRLALCVISGIVLTRNDLFPAVAARGTSQILLNIALPCLFFSRIVTSISVHNAKAIGPLILIAVIYEIFGYLLAIGIKQIFWVPHRFRWGIVSASIFSNWGDIPNAILTSITTFAPFNGTSDSNLAVAYLSIIILVFGVTLFPLGGHRMIAWDFEGPDKEHAEVQTQVPIRKLVAKLRPNSKVQDAEAPSTTANRDMVICQSTTQSDGQLQPAMENDLSLTHRRVVSVTPTVTSTALDTVNRKEVEEKGIDLNVLTSLPSKSDWKTTLKQAVIDFFKEWMKPVCLAVLLGTIIALITPIRALFVPTPTAHIPNAPDNQPPLALFLDTITFIGNAAVPVGLICLGSALARMKISASSWRDLPIGAIVSVAVGKMILLPILGLAICQALAKGGVIDPNDKVLRFVCIIISATPTATTQVYLTQVYSGTGSAEHLSPFLLPQYIIMLLSTTALTAYSIKIIF